jgi:hypothetical protein
MKNSNDCCLLEPILLVRVRETLILTELLTLHFNNNITGKMRIEVDLVPRFPHMQTMAVTFLGACE